MLPLLFFIAPLTEARPLSAPTLRIPVHHPLTSQCTGQCLPGLVAQLPCPTRARPGLVPLQRQSLATCQQHLEATVPHPHPTRQANLGFVEQIRDLLPQDTKSPVVFRYNGRGSLAFALGLAQDLPRALQLPGTQALNHLQWIAGRHGALG